MDTGLSEQPSGTLLGVQLTMARIEGMLSTVITSHEGKIEENKQKTENLDKRLGETSTQVTRNTSAIEDIRGDINQIRVKQEGSVGKAVLILSPVLTVIGLIWSFLGGAK